MTSQVEALAGVGEKPASSHHISFSSFLRGTDVRTVEGLLPDSRWRELLSGPLSRAHVQIPFDLRLISAAQRNQNLELERIRREHDSLVHYVSLTEGLDFDDIPEAVAELRRGRQRIRDAHLSFQAHDGVLQELTRLVRERFVPSAEEQKWAQSFVTESLKRAGRSLFSPVLAVTTSFCGKPGSDSPQWTSRQTSELVLPPRDDDEVSSTGQPSEFVSLVDHRGHGPEVRRMRALLLKTRRRNPSEVDHRLHKILVRIQSWWRGVSARAHLHAWQRCSRLKTRTQ
eukprot:RCo010205